MSKYDEVDTKIMYKLLKSQDPLVLTCLNLHVCLWKPFL